MSICVSWDDENFKSILCYTFTGIWDWYDFSQASSSAFRMIDEVSHEIGIIFDMSHSLDIPVGALAAMERMLTYAPSNLGVIVVAGADKVTRYTFAMLMRMGSDLLNQMTLTRSVDEARAVLLDYYAASAASYTAPYM